MYLQPFSQSEDGSLQTMADPYENDIARQLGNVSGASSADVIAGLRNMNLGDDFWMYSFKVCPCAKVISHKWSLCPCAHAGETARRRDPRFHPYRPVLCPLVKAKKVCPIGDNCMWSHNVFEHWLHPSRYKTRLCSFGRNCNRPTCFFAHSSEELRCVPNMDEGKDLDERGYLMQLMLAQEAGMIPAGSLPVPASSPQQQSTAMGVLMPGRGQAGSNASAPLPTTQGQHTPRLDTASLLLGLQESLANLNVSPDAGWQAAAISGPPSGGRISDPGQGHHPHLLSAAINPIRHLNRISDSGQTRGLAYPKDIAGLESLLTRALAGTSIAMPGTSAPVSSAPAPASSSPSGSGQLPFLPSAGMGSPGVPAAMRGNVDSYVTDLVAQLQEQGIVNSKEQLVASLSQLLAQLLVT